MTRAPGASSTSRRTLLTTSGAAVGAAFALSACASESDSLDVHKIPPEARNVDVQILNALLDREYKVIAAYTAGIPLLSGHVHEAASAFLNQEITHAGELYGLIKQAHGNGNRAKASYELGRPHTRKQIVELLRSLEQAQIAAYLEAIPNVSPGSVRAALASIMANDAQHLVVLRRALRVEPIPSAFVSGSA